MTIHDWVEVAYFGLVTWLLVKHKIMIDDHEEAIKLLARKYDDLRVGLVYLSNKLEIPKQSNKGGSE